MDFITLDQAIATLEAARAEIGGGAALLMINGSPVVNLKIDDACWPHGCVYVCDTPDTVVTMTAISDLSEYAS